MATANHKRASAQNTNSNTTPSPEPKCKRCGCGLSWHSDGGRGRCNAFHDSTLRSWNCDCPSFVGFVVPRIGPTDEQIRECVRAMNAQPDRAALCECQHARHEHVPPDAVIAGWSGCMASAPSDYLSDYCSCRGFVARPPAPPPSLPLPRPGRARRAA